MKRKLSQRGQLTIVIAIMIVSILAFVEVASWRTYCLDNFEGQTCIRK